MQSAARAQPATSGLRVMEADDVHAALSYLNVVVVLWYQSPRAEMLYQLYNHAQRLTAELRVPKVSVVTVLLRKLGEAPSPEARAALGMLHKDPREILHRSALVFVNEGFIVASIRSILLGVRNRLTGNSSNEVFKEFEAATHWATNGLVGPARQPLPVHSIVADVNRYLAHANESSNGQ